MKKLFEIKIKREGIPIVDNKVAGLDDLYDAVETVRKKEGSKRG